MMEEAPAVADILTELDDLVNQQLQARSIPSRRPSPFSGSPAKRTDAPTPCPDAEQVVTYKWLARHHGIPYDTSKRILFEFLSRQGKARTHASPTTL
jgi:hypothetical protein